MVDTNKVDEAVDKAKNALKNGEDTIKSGESGKELDAGKEAVMSAYSKLLEAKNHFLHAVEVSGVDMKSGANGQFTKGKEMAQQYSDKATSFIHERPMASLGIAFATGFVVSKLLTSSK